MTAPAPAAKAAEQSFIVYRSHGESELFEATRENAMAIFDWNKGNLPQEVLAITQTYDTPNSVTFISARVIGAALKEVMATPSGEPLPRLRSVLYGPAPRSGPDSRPEVLKERGWSMELAFFMVEHDLTKAAFEQHHLDWLAKVNLFDRLPFLAPLSARFPNGIQYVFHDDYFDMAAEYRTIVQQRWKADAPELAVVRRICRFVDETLVDRRNIRVEVCSVKAKAA